MKAATRIIILGAVAVVALDTIGSLVSTSTGFSYAALWPASIIIYALVGIAAGRIGNGYVAALTASGVVGLIDAKPQSRTSTPLGPN